MYIMLIFMFYFLTTLKYHSNEFLELKAKNEVTLLSPIVLFWLILECSKLQLFPFISMGAHFWPKYKIKEGFFHPRNIAELSQKKLRKSSQVLYRSDQGKYFLKTNQNYVAHICPEYGFRVKVLHSLVFTLCILIYSQGGS